MQLTASQQAAVSHRDGNLLLAASAGSGKTETLASRVVGLVAPEGACRIDRLLVVTFTRAAASELRARIGRKLREALATSRGRTARAHIRRQLARLDLAEIGTIDAWANRLVREHFAEAGVDPRFGLLAADQAAVLRQDCLDELFRWLCGSPEPLAQRARQCMRAAPTAGDPCFRKQVQLLNACRGRLLDPEPWIAWQRRLHDQPEDALRAQSAGWLLEAFARECGSQRAELARHSGDAGTAAYCERLRAWEQALRAANSGPPGKIEAALNDCSTDAEQFLMACKGRLRAIALDHDIRERWLEKRIVGAFGAQAVSRVFAAAPRIAHRLVTLIDVEQRFHASLQAAKQRCSAWEFDDVLRLAQRLLSQPATNDDAAERWQAVCRRPTVLAERLAQRYEHVLIDEAQDTSPLQLELLRLVTRDQPGRGNCTFVGDIKQSIYGFRDAEPRLLADLIDQYAQDPQRGKVQYLSDNFRSHARLLDGLNGIFSRMFSRSLGGSDYGEDERLVARREEPPALPDGAAEPRIELTVLEAADGEIASSPGEAGPDESESPETTGDEEDDPLAEGIDFEAELAALRIRELLERKYPVPVRRPDGTVHTRDLRPGDIAILLRSAKINAIAVARVLRNAGISCVTSGQDELLESAPVRDLRAVLALLVDRGDDVAMAAYLRGPLVELTADELMRVRRACETGPFGPAVSAFATGATRADDADQALRSRLRGALERLDQWRRAAREEDLSALLRTIIEAGGLRFYYEGLRGGRTQLALLEAFQRLAREFSRGGQRSVSEFVSHLGCLDETGLDPKVAAGAGEDAVRIMTVHAAKGLEFPIVFVLNSGAEFRSKRIARTLLFDAQLGLGLDYPDVEAMSRHAHALCERLVARERLRALEEELRLVYVALTRARERLFVIGTLKKDAAADLLQRFGAARAAPSLDERLRVTRALEWLLMAIGAGGLHAGDAPLVRVSIQPRAHRPQQAGDSDALEDSERAIAARLRGWRPAPEDRAWIHAGLAALRQGAPRTLADIPAAISVSTVKQLSQRDATEREVLLAAGTALAEPAFVQQETDGTLIGTACHRLLELIDLRALAERAGLAAEIGRLVGQGALSPEQARLLPLDDLLWLGESGLTQLALAHGVRLQREAPFVYAWPVAQASEGSMGAADGGDATIVRGIVDAVIETADAVTILDYKTDLPRNAADLESRIAIYSVQVSLYAKAVAALLRKPVRRVLLVFLRARRVVEVKPQDDLTIDRLLGTRAGDAAMAESAAGR